MANHLELYPNLVSARRSRCTQRELAEYLGITQQEISRYERGEIKASINYLRDVAEYCGVSVDYLLGMETKDRALLTPEEAELLAVFQNLDNENRIRLKERAESLLELQRTNR